jgi:hypothetical protein
MEDFFKKFMSQQNSDRHEEFTHQKFDEAPLAHHKFDSQPDEDDTFLTKTNIEGFPKAKKPSLFGNSEPDIRPPKMAVPLAYTQDQPKSDEEDSEENEEEDRGPMTTAEVQEDKKIQKLKQLLSKNKEMTVILQKERTLRLKAEAKIGEIEKLQEFEQLQVNRRPKTATEGEQWKCRTRGSRRPGSKKTSTSLSELSTRRSASSAPSTNYSKKRTGKAARSK